MSHTIVVGRDASDKEAFGDKGLITLGKSYVKMGNYTSLSNTIKIDVARSHVILIAGKRGSGKSYSIGVIAEELSNLEPETARNVASLIFDTMGIFWTMKFKNEKEKSLLAGWNLEPLSLPVKVFVPFGKIAEYQKNSIPFDATFALNAGELEPEDWLSIFNLKLTSREGVIIQDIITALKERESFSIKEILSAITEYESSPDTKAVVQSLFKAADTWGIFSQESIAIGELITPATTTILDTSVYSSIGSFNIRALVISIICRKLFQERMISRKQEELEALRRGQDYLSFKGQHQKPLLWICIDEAHEFLPKEGSTPATDSLIQLLREGRQPGISLVLATQQPGKIHTDAMSQSDIVIAHRVTAKADLEALNEIMQSYLLSSIKKQMDDLPANKGSAIILDDNSERIYPMRVRPRYTWHGGEAPVAIKAEIKI